MPFLDRIHINLSNIKASIHGRPWNLNFSGTLWYIWHWRCATIFEPGFARPADFITHILRFLNAWDYANAVARIPLVRTTIHLKWKPHPFPYVKMNTESIVAGGVLRDIAKEWILGFTSVLGRGTPLEPEL